MPKCDDCTQPKTECPKCHARAAMRADRAYDEMREAGFRSPHSQRCVEEMEEAAKWPLGRC